MADIENDVGIAEPDLEGSWAWIEKVTDYLLRYETRGDDAAAAMVPEPQQHTRLILVLVVTAAAVLAFFAIFYVAIKYEKNHFFMQDVAIFLIEFLAIVLGGLSTLLIVECFGGYQHEERRVADFLLQL